MTGPHDASQVGNIQEANMGQAALLRAARRSPAPGSGEQHGQETTTSTIHLGYLSGYAGCTTIEVMNKIDA